MGTNKLSITIAKIVVSIITGVIICVTTFGYSAQATTNVSEQQSSTQTLYSTIKSKSSAIAFITEEAIKKIEYIAEQSKESEQPSGQKIDDKDTEEQQSIKKVGTLSGNTKAAPAQVKEPQEEIVEEEPVQSGPAVYDLYCRYHGPSQAEVDAGGIIEFYDNYYASHYYDEGAIFYNFEPGTIVHIDGKTIVIEGALYGDYNTTYVDDFEAVCGCDKVFFQTCLGEGSEIVAYYGSLQ